MILKTINSEKTFQDKNFKIKIGTTNKKNPDTLYVKIGTYIKPLDIMESYTDYFNNFNKKAKKYIKKLIDENKNCCKNFILITDIADERILKNKKSYLDMQIYFKLNTNKETFKELTNYMYTKYAINIVSYVKDELKNNDFECYKNKK